MTNRMTNLPLLLLFAASLTAVSSFVSCDFDRARAGRHSSAGKSNHALLPAPSHRIQETSLPAAKKLSELPKGISPFEKSFVKNLDIPGDLRKRCLAALTAAQRDGKRLLEVDFPPLLSQGKTQFDDFDNLQELDRNRDFCVEFLPMLPDRNVWFLLPDLKEVQECKAEWTGQRYRQAATYSTIEAVTALYTQGEYVKPWGATFAGGLQSLLKNNLLGDESVLDDISSQEAPSLHLICQPGNGGPVEDWINCEMLHKNCPNRDVTTLIVNGALDKVRDGYYPAVFFPKLASTVDGFYRNFEPLFILKPISDKGLYGWLFRVYPEPWQVVLQTVKTDRNDRQFVENTVVYTSDTRPSFAEAVQKLVQGAAAQASK